MQDDHLLITEQFIQFDNELSIKSLEKELVRSHCSISYYYYEDISIVIRPFHQLVSSHCQNRTGGKTYKIDLNIQ